MKGVFRRLVACAGLLCCVPLSLAQAPRTVSLQGRLTNAAGLALPDGPRSVTFRIYNGPETPIQVFGEPQTFSGNSITLNHVPVVENSEAVARANGTGTFARNIDYTINYAAGVISAISSAVIPSGTQVRVSYQYTATKLWEETKTVTVKNGMFGTALGSTTAFPASLPFGHALYLGVQVGTDPEMTPRTAFVGAPSALSISLPYADSVAIDIPGAAMSITNSGSGTSIYARAGAPSGAPGTAAAVWGDSEYTGVLGTSKSGSGVMGYSEAGSGIYGTSTTGPGVYGSTSATGASYHAASVEGFCSPSGGVGVFAGNGFPFGVAGLQTDFTAGTTHIWCAEQGNRVFSVTAGGAVCGLTFDQCSDARYKQHIETLRDPIARVLSLRGVSFEWNPDSAPRSFPRGKQVGFVAQEVEKVLPEVVSTDSQGYKSVAYQSIVPVLVEAVKDQNRQIQAQQAEIQALRLEAAEARGRAERVDELEARLKTLEALVTSRH